MKFTIDWLKQHLDTDLNDKEIINNLTNVGLEVESFENAPSELDDFIVAKIVKIKYQGKKVYKGLANDSNRRYVFIKIFFLIKIHSNVDAYSNANLQRKIDYHYLKLLNHYLLFGKYVVNL